MTNRLLEIYRENLNPNYANFIEKLGLNKTVKEAGGAVIVDSDNRKYIDLIAGYGIFNIGHNHQRLLSRLIKELSYRPLWGRPFLNRPLAELAEELVRSDPQSQQVSRQRVRPLHCGPVFPTPVEEQMASFPCRCHACAVPWGTCVESCLQVGGIEPVGRVGPSGR